MNTSKKPRNGIIDLMKFLFTVITMSFHTGKAFPGGYIAVEFFFIVSGFLMAKSTDKRYKNGLPIGKDTLSFVFHKAAGIFPFYLIAWLLSFFVTQVIREVSGADAMMTLFRSPYNIFMLEMCGNYDMGHRIQASWYISAMLLAMLVVYPIRKKRPHTFDYLIAPVVILLFIGYVYQKGHISLTVVYLPNLFLYDGMLRAIAEISLGCICYRIVNRLAHVNFTPLGQVLLSLLELGGYLLVICMSWNYAFSDKDLVLLLILALSITLSFTGKGIHTPIFSNKLFSFLGKFSLCMYLTHELVRVVLIPWLRKWNSIGIIINHSNPSYLLFFFGFTILTSALCYLLGNLLRKTFPAIKQRLSILVIKEHR